MQISEQKDSRVAQWRDFVTERLGREPRGFCDVSAFNAQGEPAVIRVSSVVDGKPFPTLFWLIDADISLKIDRLEAAGWIARLQRDVDNSATLQEQMELACQKPQLWADLQQSLASPLSAEEALQSYLNVFKGD